MTCFQISGLIFFLKGQKLQHQANAKHFTFPEQATYKKIIYKFPKNVKQKKQNKKQPQKKQICAFVYQIFDSDAFDIGTQF